MIQYTLQIIFKRSFLYIQELWLIFYFNYIQVYALSISFPFIHDSSNQCFYTNNAQIQVTRCGAYFLHNSNPSIAYGCPTYGCSMSGRFHLRSVTMMPTFSLKVINNRSFKIIRENRKVSLMCVYRIATSNNSHSTSITNKFGHICVIISRVFKLI